MYNLILVVHIVVAIGLIGMILIQRGRSGGLVEALGGVESIFGTKTSSFFVKVTVVLAILFFLNAIFLAYLSKERGKSLMDRYEEISIEEKLSESPVSQDEEQSSQDSFVDEEQPFPQKSPFSQDEKI